MSDIEECNSRFEKLKKHWKQVANDYAMKQFNKPINERIKPKQILDFIEFVAR